MVKNTNSTHDAELESWIESANVETTDFPLQNLPVCRMIRSGKAKVGVAIGDFILDVEKYLGLLGDDSPDHISIEYA
ncbi:MAG: fumarylacetoacetase, partial [Acidobacteriota bacterium]